MSDYKPIPEAYRKNGFDYSLLHRTKHVALYSQEDNGKLIAFEVCRILKHNGRTIGGNTMPPAEFLPSTEQWGSQAWTIHSLPAAMTRLEEQDTHLQAVDDARSTN